jgi:hypothetical protein
LAHGVVAALALQRLIDAQKLGREMIEGVQQEIDVAPAHGREVHTREPRAARDAVEIDLRAAEVLGCEVCVDAVP